MRKVSSSRQQHSVKLIQKIRNGLSSTLGKASSTRTPGAIYLSDHVVTLGWQAASNSGAKKRLGSQLGELALTQSYALSLANKIEHLRKSSASLALILPTDDFSYFSVPVPPELPIYETKDALIWAAEHAGFSPISEWYWEACKVDSQYKVTLISKQAVETLLNRLQLQPSRIKHLIPVSALQTTDVSPNVIGPWPDTKGVRAVTAWLQGRSSMPSVNLFNNIAQRQKKAMLFASIQSVVVILCLLTSATMIFQPHNTHEPVPEPLVKEKPLPAHPLQLHGALWSTLYMPGAETNTVALQSINYQNQRWHIRLLSADTEAAQQWLQEAERNLNNSAPSASWKFNLVSSRLEKTNAVTHVEITL